MSASNKTDIQNNRNGRDDSADEQDDIEEIAPGPIDISASGYNLLDPLAGGKKYYRSSHHRIFVNRSLSLEKIKFFGFDMDYTIAEYKTPEFESLAYRLATKKLVDMGYPKILGESSYDPSFPIRGLWFDTLYGNFLKVDAYGNILVCVHGFKFLKTSEIFNIYPNKFVQMNDSRIYVLNTLFNQPETCLLGQVMSYFSTNKDFDQSSPYGVKDNKANLFMPFKSMFQDVRNAFDKIHADGSLKKETVDNLDQYVVRDHRIPMLFDRMRENGKKVFLLTNSGYTYTDQIMSHLFSLPSCGSRSWTSYFDFIIVDARKPLFFGEGTILRQVDKRTGALRIGTHIEDFCGPLLPDQIFSGGNCDTLTKLMGARGRDVLYVGDHIYGDILRSKKIRGWRTFLVVPELQLELEVWSEKRHLFQRLSELDVRLGDVYKNLDSSCRENPDISELKSQIRRTIHELDMSYGSLGSIFRCGSRQTHFASQIARYADLYACTFLNLFYYPFSYFFRAPSGLLPHESTVMPSHVGVVDRSASSERGHSTEGGATEASHSSSRGISAPKLGQAGSAGAQLAPGISAGLPIGRLGSAAQDVSTSVAAAAMKTVTITTAPTSTSLPTLATNRPQLDNDLAESRQSAAPANNEEGGRSRQTAASGSAAFELEKSQSSLKRRKDSLLVPQGVTHHHDTDDDSEGDPDEPHSSAEKHQNCGHNVGATTTITKNLSSTNGNNGNQLSHTEGALGGTHKPEVGQPDEETPPGIPQAPNGESPITQQLQPFAAKETGTD